MHMQYVKVNIPSDFSFILHIYGHRMYLKATGLDDNRDEPIKRYIWTYKTLCLPNGILTATSCN